MLLMLSLFGCRELLSGDGEISGRVTDSNGQGIEGVRLKIEGVELVTTDEEGKWSLSGSEEAEVTVIPAKEGWDFYPESITAKDGDDDIYFVESAALSDIDIYFTAERGAGGSYMVECYIDRYSRREAGKERGDEFSDAKVKVNGLELSFLDDFPYSFHYRLEDRNFEVEPEESLDIYLSHPSFGRIEKELKVPPVVPEIEVEGDIEQWIAGEIDFVELSWPDVNQGSYSLEIVQYDDNKESIGGFSKPVDANAYTLADRNLLETYGTDKTAEYIKLIIEGVNKYELEESEGGIKFVVGAPIGAEVSTLP